MRHRCRMTPFQHLCLRLADLVLVIHSAFCAFVVVGLVLIWIGRFRGWSYVRNIWFRALHLGCIGLVVAESIFGIECPLTTLENRLRLSAGSESQYAGSFIQAWLQRLIFFDLDERIFTLIYSAFLLAVILTFWLIPPQWPRTNRTTPPKP